MLTLCTHFCPKNAIIPLFAGKCEPNVNIFLISLSFDEKSDQKVNIEQAASSKQQAASSNSHI